MKAFKGRKIGGRERDATHTKKTAGRSLSLDLVLFLSLSNQKQAKEFSKTTYRKTTYRLREVADKFEAWSRRQK